MLVEPHIAGYRGPFLAAIASRVSNLSVVCGSIGREAMDELNGCKNASITAGVEGLNSNSPSVIEFSRAAIHRAKIISSIRGAEAVFRRRPDAVVVGNMGLQLFTIRAAALAVPRRPALLAWARVSEHTERMRSPARVAYRKAMSSRPDGWIVNGRSGAVYIASLGVDERNIFVVPQAPRELPFSRGRVREGLLYVGRLVEGKGIELLLQQHARMDNPPMLTLVGEGPLMSLAQEYRKRSPEYVLLPGWLSGQELADTYCANKYFVFLSDSDEWGLAVVEALQSGLPVIGSPYSQAVLDLVRSGENGWIVDPRDSACVGHSLAAAGAVESSAYQVMSDQAVMSAQHLKSNHMAELFLGAIDVCLERKPTAG